LEEELYFTNACEIDKYIEREREIRWGVVAIMMAWTLL
jgi:hypothetical protein